MLTSYFKIALRSLLRNSTYSIINIVGLSVGILSCILILLWVNDEISYDTFHENRDRLTQVYTIQNFDGHLDNSKSVPFPLYHHLKNEDSNIKNLCITDWGNSSLLSVGENHLTKRGLHVSREFLEMFRFPILNGSAELALSDPYSIVLTESTAKALFGDSDPIGQLVNREHSYDLKVTGVLKDLPRASSFQFDYLTSFDLYEQTTPWVQQSKSNWGNFAFRVYVEMNEAENIPIVEEHTKDIIVKNYPEEESDARIMYHPLSRWRLHSQFENGKESGGRIEYVRMFSLLGLLILIISSVNFMNLATARSEERAREVGIRKSVGSGRRHLILQFLGESLFITLIGFLIAIVMAELVLPFYNTMIGKELEIRYDVLAFWIVAFALIGVTGLFAGSYPAFFLSSFSPAKVLKGKVVQVRGNGGFRRMLVVLQFTFSIGLIISTLVIYDQLQYSKGRQLGYDQQNLITVKPNNEIRKNFSAIKQELNTLTDVASVTNSFSPVTSIYQNDVVDQWPGKSSDANVLFAILGVGADYTKTIGANLLYGRDFSEEFKSDSNAIVINQAALEVMNLREPLGQKISFWKSEWHVIGVVEDIVMESPFQKVRPMILMKQSEPYYVTIQLEHTSDLHASLNKIEAIFKTHSPSYPFDYSFVYDDYEQKFQNMNLLDRLFKTFAGLTILISLLGLFGLAAFTAEQRKKEMGIRKILGASTSKLLILMSNDFGKLVLISFLIAAPVAWYGLTQWLENYPYRVTMHLWVFGVVGGLCYLLAIVIVCSQTIKAATSNPVDCLRSE